MQLSIPFCIFMIISLIEGAKIYQLNKEAKDSGALKRVKELLRDLSTNGKEHIQEVRGNGLRLKKMIIDKTGSKLMRYQQEYEGLPMFGFHVIVRDTPSTSVAELDRETGEPTGRTIKIKKESKLRGEFVHGLDQDLGKIDKTKLNPNKALQELKETNGTKVVRERAESVIFIEEQTGTARVAYEVSFMNEGDNPSMPSALYDLDGNLIKEWDNLQTQSIVKKGTGPGGNEKIGKYTYGDDKDYLLVNDTGNGRCRYDTGKVRVMNLNGSIDDYGFNITFEYHCYNQASDEINGGYSPLNDANYFGHVVYNMFQTWYSNAPIKSLPIVLKVHRGINYANAANLGYGEGFIIGDGNRWKYPYTTLGVIAHEVAHAFTEEHSKLHYEGQSGGLNEAFSDMADRAAERFHHGYNNETFEWRLDTDIYKAEDGHGRCMNDPPCDKHSIDNITQYTDKLNVHYSSGIFNKVFYLISTYSQNNVKDAFDLFYIANSHVWHPHTGFLEAAENTLEAMQEMKRCLHHSSCYDWMQMNTIVDAFNQVGIRCYFNGNDWNCQA